MEILDGKNLSLKIKDELKGTIQSYLTTPILCVLTIGDDEASKVYVNNKKKACEYIGISFMHFSFPEGTKENVIIKKIKELNKDKNVNGIIMQLPLPKGYDEDKLTNLIDPEKDVDGLTYINQGKLLRNEADLVACTPKGIIEILDYYKIDLEGKNVCVVGRSELVGKPLSILLLNRNATVTICHSKTKDLKKITKQADILIAAVGKPNTIDKTMVKNGAVIIDVGINRVDGKICGDVNNNVDEVCSYKTPVPGGVGPMTVAMLLKNTFIAYKKQNKIIDFSDIEC